MATKERKDRKEKIEVLVFCVLCVFSRVVLQSSLGFGLSHWFSLLAFLLLHQEWRKELAGYNVLLSAETVLAVSVDLHLFVSFLYRFQTNYSAKARNVS
jgi:hypothetical protein